jgi:uncharacterized protein (DUF2461 family)
MIRAATPDGAEEGAEVRFTGKAIVSSMGESIPCDARRALKLLRALDRMARAAHSYNAFRHPYGSGRVEQFMQNLAGYDCAPGSHGRTIFIGCHIFKTRDVRVAMRRIAAENPAAWKGAIACERKAAAKSKKALAAVAGAIGRASPILSAT